MSEEELFDPNDSQYDGPGGGDSKFVDLKTPGKYLLGVRAVVKHDRTPKRENGGNKLYTRLAFVVINGAHKGESFTDRVFRSPSSYKRLSYVCRSMRITDKFNPSKDTDFERVVLGRTLKASVEVNEKGYAELKYPETDFTENELAIMGAWESTFKAKKRKALDEHALTSDEFGDDFGDDDIPF